MPTYKLTYFNARGRAEVCRLLFALAEVEYEDYRIQRDDWPKLKPSTPLGQLPMLTVDGIDVPQSSAIERFLAREFKLCGKTNLEKTKCDVVMESRNDVLSEMVKMVFEKDETKKAELSKNFKEVAMPKFIKFIEKMLTDNKGAFLVGDKVTVADLVVLNIIEMMSGLPDMNPLEVSSSVKSHCDKIKAIPKIAKWLKERPVTER